MSEQTQVTMTAEELAKWQAFQEAEKKKEEAARRKQQRENYAKMVDEELATAIPELRALSEQIKTVKDTIFGNFKTVLDMKAETIGVKENGQFS